MKRPIQFGKYHLLERINVGGMAEVFKAKAFGVEGFERQVAVKRILPNIAEDEEFITMFIDEAKISVQLTHANIAQVFDLGKVDDAYFIALEFVHGRDLRAVFDRCRQLGEPMPIAQACFTMMKVCEGLDYAHNKRDAQGREMDLVHRDVSPQNVLVAYEGEVKLIDFGIAKAIGKASKTQAGILKGKFGYMSPEQVRGLPIDRRSDIFSLGTVLYEILTNERLFVGESDFSTLEKVRNVEILPPTTYNRKIPDELERIVLKALARDVDDRYQNAIDLHDELQAFVYSAGEFCSRKDLAAWMKKLFARELAADHARREEPAGGAPGEAIEEPAAPKAASAAGGRSAPPPAPRGPASGRPSPGYPGPPGPPRKSASRPTAAAGGAKLEWDDEELETHVYENGAPDLAAALPDESGPAARTLMEVPRPNLSQPVVAPAPAGRGTPPAAIKPNGAPPDAGVPAGRARTPVSEPSSPTIMESSAAPAPGPLAYDPNKEPSAVARAVQAAAMLPPIAEPKPAVATPAGRKPDTRLYLVAGAVAAAVLLLVGLTALLLHKKPPAQITVSSDPAGADVLVNGSPAGVGTPVTLSLAEGSYEIAVQKSGYQQWTKDVEVKGGQALSVGPVALQKQVGPLWIDTDPSGAHVNVDGVDHGISPVHLAELPAGHHTIAVSGLAGYADKTQDVITGPGQPAQAQISLSPLGPPGKAGAAIGAVAQKAPPRPERTPAVERAPSPSARTAVHVAPPPPRPPANPVPRHETVARQEPRAPAPVASGGGTGLFKANTLPASDIRIDGKDVGWTPLRVELPVGAHRISGVTADGKAWGPFPVTVNAGSNPVWKKSF